MAAPVTLVLARGPPTQKHPPPAGMGRHAVRISAGGGEDDTGHGRRVALQYPRPCGVLSDGAVVFVQRQENRVRMLRRGVVTTLAGGEAGFLDGSSAQFNFPSSGTLDREGRLWLADRDNGRIRCVSNEGSTWTVADLRQLDMRPCDVAIALRHGVFATVTDCKDGAHCLVSISQDRVEVVAGRYGERGFADGVGELARFRLLYAATVGPDDRIYLADGNRVRVFDPVTRQVSTIAGQRTAGFRDGPIDQARFFTVRGIAVDSDSTIYVSDFGNDRIRVINLSSRSVATIAGGCATQSAGNTVEADCGTESFICTPYSLVLDDAKGTLFTGTGDDFLVSVSVPSKLGRWTARVAPIFLIFYLADRARAHLKPRPLSPPAIAHDPRAYSVLTWLSCVRARCHFLSLVLCFAY